MISKRSFHKMMLFDLNQRKWLLFLLFAVNLLIQPVLYLIQIQNAGYVMSDVIQNGVRISREQVILEQRIQVTENFFSSGNASVTLLLIAAAFVCAATGYAWLCSRSKVDFYHSIAVTRTKLYWVPYVDSILIALFPYVLSVLISFFGIGFVNHVVNRDTAGLMLQALTGNILVFLAVFGVCVMTLMLCGRVLIGMLLSVMLLIYGPVAQLLFNTLMDMNFSTWMDTGGNKGLYFSPLSIALMRMGTSKGLPFAEDVKTEILLIVFAAAGAAAGWLIYRRRPSETAGNAYVHPVLQAVFKIAAAVPTALVSGILFQEIAYRHPRFWFLGGALIGAFLACAVMEAVQSVDIKNIVRHWKSTGIAMAAVLAAAFLLLADPVHYDSRIPAQSDLKGIAFLDPSWELAEQVGNYYAVNIREQLDRLVTEDTEAVYPMLQKALEQTAHRNNDGDINESASNTDSMRSQIYVLFLTKNGAKKYRVFDVSLDEMRRTADMLTEDKTYREQMYPINVTTEDMFNHVSVSNWYESAESFQNGSSALEITLNEQERHAFLKVLREDINRCGTAELRSADPIGTINLSTADEDGSYSDSGENLPTDYYIYSMYENIIVFLEQKGMKFNRLTELTEITHGASGMTITYGDRTWTLTDTDAILKAGSCLRKERYIGNQEYAAVSLEYPGKELYQIDCVVKDPETLQKILNGKAWQEGVQI